MKTIKGNVFSPDGSFAFGEILLNENKIVEVRPLNAEDLTEEERKHKLLPGFVDVHSHGCIGHDTCDASAAELFEMLEFEKSQGVTSYCPTTMTYDQGRLLKIVKTIKECGHKNIKGIYLEGPFISYEKKGAQNPDYIQRPNAKLLEELIEAAGGLVKFVAIAPEVEGAVELIKQMKDIVHFSMAHTNGSYEDGMKAIEAGANQVTHLYNGMAPYTHREPGIIGAGLDSNCYLELICDGIHIHEAVIRNTFKMAHERILLISDSMEATGMSSGEYALGGQKVFVNGKKATLADGTIAGSASSVLDCFRHCIEIGVDESSAIMAATINPAHAIGLDDVGLIKAGYKSDILVFDDNYNLMSVIQSEDDLR